MSESNHCHQSLHGMCVLADCDCLCHENQDRELEAKAEGYRKALDRVEEYSRGSNRGLDMEAINNIAREALSDAATENPNAGHGWITGTADMDAIEGHAMREPVPEAGEAPYLTIGEAAMIGKNAAEHALARACRERDLTQETIRQRDERIKSLADALKPFHEAYVLYENALTLPRAEEHLQSVSSIHFAIASDIYESAAPPAPCPTCKGAREVALKADGWTGRVSCPTCSTPKCKTCKGTKVISQNIAGAWEASPVGVPCPTCAEPK